MYSDGDIARAMARAADRAKLQFPEHAPDNWIRITPELQSEQLQPCTVDLRLGRDFVCFKPIDFVDMRDRQTGAFHVSIGSGRDSYFELAPRTLVLGTTLERVELGPRIWGRVEGKSSMGRLGLMVHITAGFLDPGFEGSITLELYNVSATPIRLRPDMAICQVAFGELTSRSQRPYGSDGLNSHYQWQCGATAARGL